MTNTFFAIWTGIFGLVFGSFANVIVVRDSERASIMTGRSKCPHCKHVLAWYDLFPLFSFLTVGGKCRYCRKPISRQYPLMELLSASLCLLAFWYGYVQRGSVLLWILLSISLLGFLVFSAIDIISMELPIEYTVVAGVFGALAMLLSGQQSLISLLEGAALGAGIIIFIIYTWKFFFKQDGMGSGDIWIAGAVGAITGFPLILVALMAAVLSGAVIGVLLLGFAGKSMRTAIPFGPFLFAGLLIALVWGQALVHWYIL